MQVFDASSMIYAWDHYPLRQFPGLWKWMAVQIKNKTLMMPSVAFEEVASKTPDCGEWLKSNDLEVLQISNVIVQAAMRIKELLRIVGDQYHPKGVGEIDLLIIATSKAQGAELVSDEEKQSTLPQIPAKRKIPAVCLMAEVSLPCINFVEYIKRSDVIFH
jgi:predicted nucleic acid-binding protein